MVTQVGKGIYVPISSRVYSRIEYKHTTGIPVAVDVLGSCCASTSLLVVRNLIANAVASVRVVGARHNSHLPLLDVVVVLGTQTVGEGRLQSRVTLGDVERVAVVGNVEKVGHRGLRCISAVVYAQTANVRESVAEVERWRYINHIAHRVGIQALVVLHKL